MAVIERAFAKINLDLAIGARRPDGCHEVRTVLQTLDLHDTLTFETIRGSFRLEGSRALMPLDRSNLIWRAAEALWQVAGRTGPAARALVRVVKRTPSQAGLGGGSSDAASALVGLNRLWRVGLSLPRLVEIGATLGADVPFFLYGGTALGCGRGDEVYPLADLPRRFVVVVQPGFGVSTADAYRWLADARTRGESTPRPPVPWSRLPSGGRNDFEAVVERAHPEIAAARELLVGQGAELARMSGSGSAIFGLFPRPAAARRAKDALARAGMAATLTRTRPRSAAQIRRLG